MTCLCLDGSAVSRGGVIFGVGTARGRLSSLTMKRLKGSIGQPRNPLLPLSLFSLALSLGCSLSVGWVFFTFDSVGSFYVVLFLLWYAETEGRHSSLPGV